MADQYEGFSFDPSQPFNPGPKPQPEVDPVQALLDERTPRLMNAEVRVLTDPDDPDEEQNKYVNLHDIATWLCAHVELAHEISHLTRHPEAHAMAVGQHTLIDAFRQWLDARHVDLSNIDIPDTLEGFDGE